jgi:dolichyl-phosphate-mannose-protein mannosyltransferase
VTVRRTSPLWRPLPSTGWRGWAGPIGVAAIAGVLRFTNLGRPDAVVFDETYYAKDALALLRFGTEQKFAEGADDTILASDGNWRTLDVFTGDPSYVVHPPFGKWTIASGEWLFGMTPFGWRFAVALLGTLSVLLIARIVRRLTRSDLLGVTAGLLLAIDGIHIVLSRTALLDMVLSFWVLAAFGFLLLDRDMVRKRWTDRIPPPSTWGPRLGARPYRWAAGVSLGLACGVKWSGLWFLAVFGLMTVIWDVGLRRRLGVLQPWGVTLLRSAPPAFIAMVGTALVVYVLTWSGWIFTDAGWGRQWAQNQPDSIVPDWIRSLWQYHVNAWNFHVGLGSDHSYESNPLSWFLQTRPTSFFYRGDEIAGVCGAERCSAAVTALGNPIIWWVGSLALIHQVWRWIAVRDWRSGAVLAGVVAGWAPWLLYLDRTIFTFYTVAFVPFIVMALTLSLGTLLGPPPDDSLESRDRRRWGALGAGAIVLLAVIAAWWFYPVWTGVPITYEEWTWRMWMPSWI